MEVAPHHNPLKTQKSELEQVGQRESWDGSFPLDCQNC